MWTSDGWRRGLGWGVLCLGALGVGCASGSGAESTPAVVRARELIRSGQGRGGNLILRCEPEDADVYLDDVAQGVCTDFGDAQGGLRVGEGLHRIDVKKEGHWPYTTYYEPGRARAVVNIRLPVKGSGGQGR